MTATHPSVQLADWPVAILAGGLATRLRPHTEKVPKALLEVAGQPFILHQLNLLRSSGFRRIFICVGYLGEQIQAFLGDGSKYGMELRYSSDGPRLLGTGGALKQAGQALGSRFLVLYGDSYLPIDYQAIVASFLAQQKPALMTVFRNDGRWDRSNVSFESGRIRRYSKRTTTPDMNYIEYGLGVLTAEVFRQAGDTEVFDLADLYEQLVERGEMAAYEVKQRFYEIGSAEGLAELDRLLCSQPHLS